MWRSPLSLLNIFPAALSLVVNAENDARAEQRSVLIRIRGIVIVGFVPEALRRHTDALAQDLTDDALDDNFVARDVQLLGLVLDVHNDGLSPLLVLLVIELGYAVQLRLNAMFDDLRDFGGVEAFVLSWLHPVGGQVSHARVTEINHLL